MNWLLWSLVAAGPAGRSVPDLTLITLKGDTLHLADLRGHVVIVDFWATWCPPCRAEMPFFNELYKTYRDSGVVILGINLDEPRDKVERFLKKLGIEYPVALGRSHREGQAFGGILGLPTTFVVDPDGTIRARAVGYHPREYFEGWIKKLLRERSSGEGS